MVCNYFFVILVLFVFDKYNKAEVFNVFLEYGYYYWQFLLIIPKLNCINKVQLDFLS